MKVYGYEVLETTLEDAFASLPEVFTTRKLEAALVARNVPDGRSIAHRAADRFIQKLRKAGRVHYEGRCWHKAT